MLSRAHVIFEGKVQGVFFRANTRKFALANGINGWVMNLPDGTVEAVFEGERGAVERTIDMCAHQQPLAEVKDYWVEWEEYTGAFISFEIQR